MTGSTPQQTTQRESTTRSAQHKTPKLVRVAGFKPVAFRPELSAAESLTPHSRAREQAERIDLTWTARGPSASYVQIINDSRRPIREVACRIQQEDGSLAEPDRAGELSPFKTVNGDAWMARKGDIMLSHFIPVIRIGGRAGFEFSLPRNQSSDRSLARFTDDASLHWELDNDLHLAKLDDRDSW